MKTQITIIILGLMILCSPSLFAQKGTKAHFSELTTEMNKRKMPLETNLKKLETKLIPAAQRRFPKIRVTSVSIDRNDGGIIVHDSNGGSHPGNTANSVWDTSNYGASDYFWDWYYDVDWSAAPTPGGSSGSGGSSGGSGGSSGGSGTTGSGGSGGGSGSSGIPAYKDPLMEILDDLD